MIWNLDALILSTQQNWAKINGTYVPARPMPPPWNWRLHAAWEVLRGRADAVHWPANQ